MKKFLLLPLLLLFPFALQAAEGPRLKVSTSAGDFVIQVYPERAPLTVANFLEYVESGFYRDTIFHRVVDGFVVQGGGYTGDLTLKPVRATIPNESGNGLSNRRGTVAMARTAEPHSADAQFYVNLADNVGLDPKPTRWGYTVFGEIVEGMEIVDDIGHAATTVRDGMQDVPMEAVRILDISVAGADDGP